MTERCQRPFIIEKPRLKPLEEIRQVVREQIFEPEYSVKVALIQRGQPQSPLPEIDQARDLYVTGDSPEILVDGIARKIQKLNPRKVIVSPLF